MAHTGHPNELSLKRQERAKRHLTARTKGTKDGRCIRQEVEDIGFWPSGQVKQRVRYLHVTKGWRVRVLPPLQYRRAA